VHITVPEKALVIPAYAIIHLNQHSSWTCAHWLQNVVYKNIKTLQKYLKRSQDQWKWADLGVLVMLLRKQS